MTTQSELFEQAFETSKPANPLFCHEAFLEKVADHSRDAIGRRCSFLMQRLAVDARRLHYKATAGVNRGWRRSRLGGNHGCHYYAWWAPKNAVPLKQADGFSEVPDGAIFLRDIRHHDDHAPLDAQSLQTHYLPVTVRDLRREEYAPVPWNAPQARFASARQPVRILKGHPGSGKTTALWNAVDAAGAQRALYVTYSRDLALLARDYFDRFCSSHKRFEVITFPDLVRQLLSANTPKQPERESRERFLRDIYPFARSLGAWTNKPQALYDEMHAHLIGEALPVEAGRFAACKRPRISDAAYRQRRTRFLGDGPALAVLDAAARLERADSASLAERYFPEAALAWNAAGKLLAGEISGSRLDFDCIGIDECQDLTPLEALLLIELSSRAGRQRRNVPLLIAGDEAQTVRPTDFEWAWLNDLLHARIGTPSEHKLSANLRSPRRIAELTNRVWDLYSCIHKQERPSGAGAAEIEDDAADQILYCSALPGPDLDALLTSLSAREGLALITLQDSVPAYIPDSARTAVLTVAEAKGLDFHSVCVLDAGHQIERVLRDDGRFRMDTTLDFLNKRLAIDQLRVALSRPSERLIWLDIKPTDQIMRDSLDFLNGGAFDGIGVSSCVPSALLKALEEDDLDLEERVQRCQADARQFLEVKPEIAWSRAQQAITLLGHPGSLASIADEAARRSAHLTLAEVAFTLGIRNAKLPPELGRPDLFGVASNAARSAGRHGLASILYLIGQVQRAPADARLTPLASLAQDLPRFKSEVDPWLLMEIRSLRSGWTETLESALFNGRNAGVLLQILPGFYEALEIDDRDQRLQRLRQRAVQFLIKDKQFAAALAALRELSERMPKLEAVCHEGLGDFRAAAECHLVAGSPKDALNCYRSIPDLAAATRLAREIEHPAAESLEWIARLQQIVAERPEKFTKTTTAAEKKALENLLEQALGVARRKPAPRKAAVKKTAVKKTQTPRKRAASPGLP